MEWSLEAIQDRIYTLAAHLRTRLAEIDGVTVTDEGAEQCGIVTFMAEQKEAQAIKTGLAAHKINVSISTSSGSLIYYEPRGIKAVVRASVHYFNTVAELDFLVDTLKPILKA